MLKQWHWQDPPDNWEVARNDFIESEQGNRNPFVDSVNWVCYIDFETFTHIADPEEFPCTTTPSSVQEEEIGDVSISPNPATDQLTINITVTDRQELTAVILDLSGKEITRQYLGSAIGQSQFYMDLAQVSVGMYMLSLQSTEGTVNRPFVVQ